LRRVEEFARDAIDSTRANATVVGQILKMGVGQ
ncbi:MAG: hypothetical protein RLZZ600_872, partial [Actinomycetota bacterium]